MRRFKLSDFTTTGHQLVAEASCLNLPPGRAVKEFEVQSHVTGTVIPFAMQDIVRDADGDVLYFVYESTGLYTEVFSAKIFND